MVEPHDAVIEGLIGVYHAEGTLRGELAYAIGKLLGRSHCALCDITHTALRRRRSFDAWAQALPVAFELVHLDERSRDVAAASAGRTPCVLVRTSGGVRILLDPGDLEACSGDVDRLVDAIARAIAARDVRWPDTA